MSKTKEKKKRKNKTGISVVDRTGKKGKKAEKKKEVRFDSVFGGAAIAAAVRENAGFDAKVESDRLQLEMANYSLLSIKVDRANCRQVWQFLGHTASEVRQQLLDAKERGLLDSLKIYASSPQDVKMDCVHVPADSLRHAWSLAGISTFMVKLDPFYDMDLMRTCVEIYSELFGQEVTESQLANISLLPNKTQDA